MPLNNELFSIVFALTRSAIAMDQPSNALIHQIRRLESKLPTEYAEKITSLLKWHEEGRQKPDHKVIAAGPDGGSLTPIDPVDAMHLYGRMMECADIELAIESGQFSELNEVLVAMKSSSQNISKTLVDAGFIESQSTRRWTMQWIDGVATPIRLN